MWARRDWDWKLGDWELATHVCNMSPGERNGIVWYDMQHLRGCVAAKISIRVPRVGGSAKKNKNQIPENKFSVRWIVGDCRFEIEAMSAGNIR